MRKVEHILDGVRCHHENFDGSGYPNGLKGEDIPFMGRLLAVADCFAAMTVDRPYRGSLASTGAAGNETSTRREIRSSHCGCPCGRDSQT